MVKLTYKVDGKSFITMRINRYWLDDIFNHLRKYGEITVPEMREGGYYETSHEIAILYQAGLIVVDFKPKPVTVFVKGYKIKNSSNSKLWKLLQEKLPVGSQIKTLEREKISYIVEWNNEMVHYAKKEHYHLLKKNGLIK